MEDTEIIELYFARSEQAIYKTDKKYGPYLSQLAYNVVHSYDDTEEIMDDTYFRAWNAIPPARPTALKHFLSRITRNLALDRLDYLTAQKRTADAELPFDEWGECVPDSSGMDEAWESRQIGISINKFLEMLEKIDCAVFISRYFYGQTVVDISHKYDLPPRRVKYILSRLRAALKIHLETEGIVV